MKQLISCITTLLMLTGTGYCEPLIYSFEGEVSDIFFDGAGIIASEGYKIGDHVYANFYVDFEREGYYITNNGETVFPKDPQMTNNPHWYFYSSLIAGTLLPEINGGLNNGPGDIKERHYSYFASGPSGNSGVLQGGTGDSTIVIRKDSNVQTWVIGEELRGIIMGCNEKNDSVMWADMRLTEIKGIALPPATVIVPARDADGSYSIRWTTSDTGEASYVLQEATNASFTSGLRTAYTGSALRASISGRVKGKKYYYRVKANRTGYMASDWKTGDNGCLIPLPLAGASPSITAPTRDTDGAYVVTWKRSSTSGVTYFLEESTTRGFTTGKRIVYNGTGLSKTITGRTKGRTYYYRVKATKPKMKDSAWKSTKGTFIGLQF